MEEGEEEKHMEEEYYGILAHLSYTLDYPHTCQQVMKTLIRKLPSQYQSLPYSNLQQPEDDLKELKLLLLKSLAENKQVMEHSLVFCNKIYGGFAGQ